MKRAVPVGVVAALLGAACASGQVAPGPDDVDEPRPSAPSGPTVGPPSTPVAGSAFEVEPARSGIETIDDLANVGTGIVALGSVWAVLSNLPDEFSPGEVRAEVVRIDPASRQVEPVIASPGLEPRLVEAGGLVWIKLVDRVAGFDADGREVRSVGFDLDRSDDLAAGGGLLWVVLHDQDRVLAIDPATAETRHEIETGAFPVSPVEAFGFIWTLNLIDGTVSVIDASDPEAGAVTVLVTDGPRFIVAVPGASTGNEVWVTNTDGEVVALSANPDRFGQTRRVEIDRAVNTVIVHGDRVVVLPTWGSEVLVLDLASESVLARIPIDSIPVRGLSAHGHVWVTGDGTQETLTAIDPDSLEVRARFTVGSNLSTTTGPRQPLLVGQEIWVPNRGDDAIFIVDAAGL